MKKGQKIFLIIIAIILCCGFGVGGWFLGTKYANKEDSKKVEEKKEETKEEETKEETKEEEKEEEQEDKNELPTLSFPRYLCGGVDFTLKEKTVYAKDISDDDKLAMLAGVLLEFNTAEVPDFDYYNEDGYELDFDIKEVAKKYFDVTKSMEKKIEEGFGDEVRAFSYKNNKSYYYFLPGGCEGAGNGGDEVRLKGTKKDGNTIIETYYYYYTVVSEDFVDEEVDGYTYSYSPVSVYKSKNDKKPVYKDLKGTQDIDLSDFNTYDIYFDTTGGNMKLEKIVFNKK